MSPPVPELDPRLVEEIRTQHATLRRQAERVFAFSREELDGFRANFRARFGPDRLVALDGDDLLHGIHGRGTPDSLVYWLEFKDDDEFPMTFGSIAGGSALKFGIYCSKETGQWFTGSATKQREISRDEAVELVRGQRDQFLRGVAVIEHLSHSREIDPDPITLQAMLEVAAPDIAETAWGHKYFSLLFPDHLDDYHSPDFQRFHLLKLLIPQPEQGGRYLCARSFAHLARTLAIPMNAFTATLNRRHGRPHAYWRVGTSVDGDPSQSFWEEMRDHGYISIGFRDIGDLSGIEPTMEGRHRIRDRVGQHYPGDPRIVGRSAAQVHRFVTKASRGDIVLAAQGQTILGIARVNGDYVFRNDNEFPHRRPVEWLSTASWTSPVSEGLQTTFSALRNQELLLAIERRILDAHGTDRAPAARATPTPSATAQLTGIPRRISDALARKRQVILYGPPGTGKTHWAMITARELAARSWFERPFDDLEDDQRRAIVGEDEQEGAVQACCFHPGYGYEDFIEGLRPAVRDGALVFERRDGIFKRLCDRACAPENHHRAYYLIIDEINRGDIPRIFGELLTILEANKRGQPITLPLSATRFSVPKNVYVIGTMNPADRSVALLDAALRRRFAFIELMPDPGALRPASVARIPLEAWLGALNERVLKHLGRDARNLQIGHAYLMERGVAVRSFDRFVEILRDDLIPLLEEYCYENFDALEQILGPAFINRRIRATDLSIFDPARRDELRDALLTDDRTTAEPAIAADADAASGDETDEADDA
ncbi:MAG: AAA family ATPase [Nannocystaceae bacterium]